ncbi:MAG: hypothetical protein PHH00_02635 [Candidatus Nanoarchaeia archaeon]|nr:hypothetical protein [Candidatus Nanoarchaeia archaeon]
MIEREKSPKRLTMVLVGVIIALVLLVAYAFIVKPSINGFAVKLQNDAFAYTLNAIVSQVQQNGYVQIPAGNQTLTLIRPELCSQLAQDSSTTSAK